MNDLNTLTIKEARDGLLAKKFSSLELTEACLKRIKKVEKKLHSFVTVTEEQAINLAKEADKLIAERVIDKKLLGIPISLKDNYCTQGIRTTASSKVLDNFIPPYNATVWQKLRDAGAILIGKNNMDAWAHGSSTETSDYGTTLNPWDTSKLPGGSSGGCAAAVASDEVIASLGTETAGSIRQPASWCGVVGLKPTYGRVSRYGIIAMGSSLDCPGPISKTVYDSALILSIISGRDNLDATTLPINSQNYEESLQKNAQDFTIGYSEDYFEGVDKKVQEKVFEIIGLLTKKGIKISKINLFPPKYAIAVYTILQRSEVSSNLARYDGIRFGFDRDRFGDEAKRRIMFGTYSLSAGYYDAYYLKAQKVRTKIIQDFQNAFNQVDLIIGPSAPTVALPIGASKDQAMFGEMADILVEPSSIAGLPGINIPIGLVDNLPVGLQLIGPQKSEQSILQAAYQIEKLVNFQRKIIL